MDKCIVAVPIYKDIPNELESLSFRQVLRVLYKYEIIIFTYDEVNLDIYSKISKEENKRINIIYFNKEYFTDGTNGYNKLLLNRNFYNTFAKYEYLLIYQLDAWVFSDQLKYWCEKGYDYVGAPWFKRNKTGHFTTNFDGVGNGGFSLRKISYCMKLLDYSPYKPFITIKNLIKTIDNPWKLLKVFAKIFGLRNNLYFFIKNKINEDYIFSELASLSYIKTNIPDEISASKFSFEVNPSYLYKVNNDQLPFGCHAFEKYEYDVFWKKKIILKS